MPFCDSPPDAWEFLQVSSNSESELFCRFAMVRVRVRVHDVQDVNAVAGKADEGGVVPLAFGLDAPSGKAQRVFLSLCGRAIASSGAAAAARSAVEEFAALPPKI
ncbi:hypothetical protein ACTOB_002234 [Actinoplanes oblitus]|uniref:Uncharacterized protein n=1 Tax=Actinoplanes oblitus TaxID=3040509 RepID=A0ABY8WP26_9ACTN|nr:hypothetical protein [Actinoplanes oblitus]WIM98630.1 hypothetical protein ACTOB_002234 [Actinoplanes oblitus]